MCATGYQAIGLVLLKPIGAYIVIPCAPDTGQETTGLALSLLGCILHKSSLLPSSSSFGIGNVCFVLLSNGENITAEVLP